MFKEAKEVCSFLTIALQDDATFDRPFKCKPVQTWEDRQEILLSVRYVNTVIRYSTEVELENLLSSTIHDVRILGADYLEKPFTGDFLNKHVHYCKRNHGYSLTALKKKIAISMGNL